MLNTYAFCKRGVVCEKAYVFLTSPYTTRRMRKVAPRPSPANLGYNPESIRYLYVSRFRNRRGNWDRHLGARATTAENGA